MFVRNCGNTLRCCVQFLFIPWTELLNCFGFHLPIPFLCFSSVFPSCSGTGNKTVWSGAWLVSCFLIFASGFAMSNAHVYCIFSTCGCGTASSVEFYFFCLHNGGSICHLFSFILSIQGACSCSWLGRFLWQQQIRFALVRVSFCLHPFPFIFPWKESNGCSWLLRGLRCFARIIPPSPFSFPFLVGKKTAGIFFPQMVS